MNSLYIGVGVAIILALITALVGPYFIDWTAYRAVFEREGQSYLGERVTVLGRAQVRLLPMPALTLEDVIIGPVDRPDMKIARLDLKLEMTPLLKGEIRVAELRLDRPVLRVGLDVDGHARFLGIGRPQGEARDLSDVGLEVAEIVDGTLLLSDARSGSETVIDMLNATASAAVLSGPIKLEGGANLDGRPITFRLATGKRGDDGLWPVRLQANPVDDPVAISLEAVVDPSAAAPRATGTLTAQRLPVSDGKNDKFMAPPTPWQVETRFVAEPARVTLETIALTVGPEDRAYTITGKGQLLPGVKPSFEIQLAAKQIDLDRLMAMKVGEAADLPMAQARLLATATSLPTIALPGRFGLDLAGVVLGGAAIQDVHLDLRTRADGWAIDSFEAKLPGRSKLTANGRLTLAEAPGFEGMVSLASDQPPTLLQWWKTGAGAKLEPFTIAGRATLGPGRVRIDELRARIGAATATGALDWTAASARLKLALSANQLDLDQVRAVASLASADAAEPQGAILGADLDLDAGVLVIAGQSLKGVAITAAFAGDRLSIERLTIRDAVGAAVDVKGRIDRLTTTPDGALEGSIRAERLDGLAKLIDVLGAQAPWTKRVGLALPALGPFDVKARLTGVAKQDASDLNLVLDGKAATSSIGLNARFVGNVERWREARIDATASLGGPDGGLVLRQLGLPALSDRVSTGRIAFDARGTTAKGLTLLANADFGGARLGLTGLALWPDSGPVTTSGDVTFKTGDLVLLATMLGQALPAGGTALPVDAKLHLEGIGPRLAVTVQSARVADVGATATTRLDLGQWPVKLEGDLKLTGADVSTLLEFGLGSDAFMAPAAKGGPWPDAVLGGPILPWLVADLRLDADRMTLDANRRIDRFSTLLRLRPSEVHLDAVNGVFAGGKLTGALGIATAAGGEMAVTGNLQLKGAALQDVAWRRTGRSVTDGTFDLTMTFETAGRSLAAMASNLSGNGALKAVDGQMRYVDPAAFGAIIVAADGGMELKEDKIRTVFQGRLDAGVLPFDRIEAAFVVGAGVLRAKDIVVATPLARGTGSLSLDFGRWTMDADWTLKVDAGKNGVVGADPQVGVLFRGPLDNPTRTLDVAPLSAFLTLRAFEREVQRVEALQQDIVERDRFARELKRLKDERLKREQDAKAGEEAKKAEDLRKLEDAKKAEEAKKTSGGQIIVPSLPQTTPQSTQPLNLAPKPIDRGGAPDATTSDRQTVQPAAPSVLILGLPPGPPMPLAPLKQ